jgi:hypothetical protein
LTDDNREIDSLDTTEPEKEPEKKKTAAVNEEMAKRLYTIAGVKGYTAAKVKATMLKKFKVTSATALTKAQYETMTKGYEGLPDKGVKLSE